MAQLIAFSLVVLGVSGFCASNSFVNGVLPLGSFQYIYDYVSKPHWRLLVVAVPNLIISYMIATAFRFDTPTAFATAECAGVLSLIILSCLMKGIVPNWQIYCAALLIITGTLWLTHTLINYNT